MLYSAYMDETGHSSDTNFAGMAGLVAPVERWEVFEQDWKAALKEFDLAHFHMKEYAHSTGQFKKFKGDEGKRREIYGRLMDIIAAAEAMPMGSVVSMADWKDLSEEARKALIDPYFLCLQDCARGAAVYAMFEPPEDKVTVTFDDCQEFRGRVPRLYVMMQERFDDGPRMGAYSFANSKEVVQLQAADIVAYEFGKYLDNKLRRPDLPMRWGFTKLMEISIKLQEAPWFIYYDKAGLQKIERPLKEALRREREAQRGQG
jgi:Protein of unknown function (DUF3800)